MPVAVLLAMRGRDPAFRRELEARGINRRDFAGFCAGVAALLALPRSAAGQIAAALQSRPKPTLVWLEFQDCAGCTESFLRASKPTAAEIILDLLSVDYHETIMAAAGARAEAALAKACEAGGYIAVVEGSIPMGVGGGYCTIGGRSAVQIAREVCERAAAVVAVGSCASFGGLPAAAPNPTGALSVAEAVPGIKTLINLPGCPVNADNLTALVSYFLTYGHWPALDSLQRPLFAYGKTIHDNCERRAHFDAGQYVERWGDEGHRAGYCLYNVGCKGPATFHNCPIIRWNDHTSWPVGCGHPCIGCSEPAFWDRMTPFYQHMKDVAGFGLASNLDKVGLIGTAAVAAGFTAHGLVQLTRKAKRTTPGPAGLAEPPAPTVPADKEAER